MATLRQIITNAYRENGIIQKGGSPDAAQLDEGLTELGYVIDNLFEEEVGARYTDILFGDSSNANAFGQALDRSFLLDNLFAFPNYRILCHNSEAKTVYLDPHPADGSLINIIDVAGNFATYNVTLQGNGRLVGGNASVALNTDSDNKKYMYRADLADWQELTALTVDSQSPFPSKYDLLLTLKLAMRLHPRHLVDTRAETGMAYKEILRKFRSQYTTKREARSELGLVRLSHSRRSQDYYIDDTTVRFNHGLVY